MVPTTTNQRINIARVTKNEIPREIYTNNMSTKVQFSSEKLIITLKGVTATVTSTKYYTFGIQTRVTDIVTSRKYYTFGTQARVTATVTSTQYYIFGDQTRVTATVIINFTCALSQEQDDSQILGKYLTT